MCTHRLVIGILLSLLLVGCKSDDAAGADARVDQRSGTDVAVDQTATTEVGVADNGVSADGRRLDLGKIPDKGTKKDLGKIPDKSTKKDLGKIPDKALSKDLGKIPDKGKVPDQTKLPDQKLPDKGSGTIDVLKGYWVWEKRVMGTVVQPPAPLDAGQMKIAFGTGNNKCHYIWNETTGSDFHTECTYTLAGDMVTYNAKADPDGTAAGYSCAHPTWTSWNDRPAVEWGRYKFVNNQLWLGVNAYWGGANGSNGSCKRFPFWESLSQAQTEEAWIVFKPVTRAEWYGKYAISTTCQGTAVECAQWPGCGSGDKAYVD